MPNDRPGFYSLTHVEPSIGVPLRKPGVRAANDLGDELLAAKRLLEEHGFKVIPPKENPYAIKP